MCFFIRKCTFFGRFKNKIYKKRNKYVILLVSKSKLFHDKKTGSADILKESAQSVYLQYYGNLFVRWIFIRVGYKYLFYFFNKFLLRITSSGLI